MTRWRSPRQRRDAARKRRQSSNIAALRCWLADQDALRERTEVERLAEQYGVEVREVPSRHPDGVEAIGVGWRVMGSLGEVRAELEQRCARYRTDPKNVRGSALFAGEITTYSFAAGNSWPGKCR